MSDEPEHEPEQDTAHSEDDREEIEEERERRLDEDNRPDGAIVDNTDGMPDVVKEFDEENPPDTAGTSDPAEKFREVEVSEEEQREIEEERERRLDPDNRPDNAEVDNTGRRFEDGEFVDDGPGDGAGEGEDGED